VLAYSLPLLPLGDTSTRTTWPTGMGGGGWVGGGGAAVDADRFLGSERVRCDSERVTASCSMCSRSMLRHACPYSRAPFVIAVVPM